jgi:hypothetical protein
LTGMLHFCINLQGVPFSGGYIICTRARVSNQLINSCNMYKC